MKTFSEGAGVCPASDSPLRALCTKEPSRLGCPDPKVVDVTGDNFTISWESPTNSGIFGFLLEFKASSSSAWETKDAEGKSIAIELQPNITYNVRLKARTVQGVINFGQAITIGKNKQLLL